MNSKITLCLDALDQSFHLRKLSILEPYKCDPRIYFVAGSKIKFATTIAYADGEAGVISYSWGVIFIDPDKPKRCTPIFTSYYNETGALDKLLKHLLILNNEQA